MAKVLLMATRGTGTIAAGATNYSCVTGFAGNTATEANVQQRWRSAGTFSNFAIRVTANNNASGNIVFTLRTGNPLADTSAVVTFTPGQTGYQEDAVTTVAVVAGDYVSVKVNNSAGNGTVSFQVVCALFEATTNTVIKYTTNGSTNWATASTSFFLPISGVMGSNTNETVDDVTMRVSGTLKNLGVYVSANARTTDTTIVVRKNNIDQALTLTIGAGVTGLIEDTTHTVAVTAGDRLNYKILTGASSETLTIQQVWSEYETTNNQHMLVNAQAAGFSINAATDAYPGISGQLSGSNATQTTMRTEANVAMTLHSFSFNINSNTLSGSSTVELHKGGVATAMSQTVTAGATGVQQDTDSVSILASDELNYRITTGAGTSLRINAMTLLVETAASGGGSSPAPVSMLALLGVG